MKWFLPIFLFAMSAHGQSLDEAISALATEPGLLVGVWCGGPSGAPLYEREASRSLPAASVVKTAILVELFAGHAAALDVPLGAPLDAVLADDHHPAMAPFSAKDRAEVRAAFAGATPRSIARIMMASQKASNAVYNGAANLAIALLGGPAEVTTKIHARDPAFAGIQVGRYMLASRKTVDNEATPAALAAVLRAIASGKLPGVDDATAAAILAAMAQVGTDRTLGARIQKEGNLDSDPMTMVKTGFFLPSWRGDAGHAPLVYVVALALPAAPAGSRGEAHKRLEKTVDGMIDVLVAAAKKKTP